MKITATDLELARVVMPALRMMVRFPTRPNKNVSFETSIELSDIEAWTNTRGRPTAALLQELEAALEGKAPGRPRVPAPPPEEDPPAAASEKPAATVPHVARRRRASDPSDSMPKFIEIAKLLLADPTLLQAGACKQVGLNQGTWSYFKTREFGPGLVAREKLVAFLKGGEEKPGNPSPASGALAKIADVAPIKPEEVKILKMGGGKTVGVAADPLSHLELAAAFTDIATAALRAAVLLQRAGLDSARKGSA